MYLTTIYTYIIQSYLQNVNKNDKKDLHFVQNLFKVARLAWQDIKILLSGIGYLKMEHDKYKRMEMEVA